MPTWAGTVGTGRRVLRFGEPRMLSQDPLDVFDFAAHDGGIDAVVRDLRILLQNPHRGMPRNPVCGASAHVMVGASVFQETGNELRVRCRRFTLSGTTFEDLLQLFPTVLPILTRKGVLDVAEHRFGGRVRMYLL